jgi:nucleoid DNA-binding protein
MAEKIEGTLNRKEFAARVAHSRGVDPRLVEDTVYTVFEEIARVVAGGGRISISNFGTFRPVALPPHNGRNIGTGEPTSIPEVIALRFRATGLAKDMVRNGDSNGSIRKKYSK